MNGLMQLSVGCLLLFAGCQSTDRLTSWMRRDSSPQAANPIAQNQGGLPPATQSRQQASSGGFPDTVAEHVKIGQNEVAAWYTDQKSHHLSAARMHFEEALRQRPRHGEAHHGLAIVADLEKNYAEAERHYQMALEQTPQDSKLLGDLGYSYLLQNRLADSERYLLRALQADPSNQNAIKHLGDAYARQGKTQLAEENYRKVLTPEQTQRALANNRPSTGAQASLTEKLFPGRNEPRDMTAEIKDRMEQERMAAEQRRQQQVGATAPTRLPPGDPRHQPQPRLSPEDRLKQDLASIDNEPYHGRGNGPIVIDPQTGHPQPLAGGDHGTSWGGQPGLQATRHQWAADPPREFAAAPVSDPTSTTPWNSPLETPGTLPPQHPGTALDIAGMQPSQRIPSVDPLTQPWSGVEPALSTAAPQGVGPALHQQPIAQASSPVSSVPPNLPAPAGSPFVAQPPAQPNLGGNPPHMAYGAADEMSKAAARMGMGMGPGSMFPVFTHAPSVSSPGAHSHWNGESFPAPQRHLPTELPAPDLSRAFHPEPAQMTTPPNHQGQSMPPSNPQVFSQQQFGTASRYDAQTLQQANVPPTAFAQPQDQERRRADEQLNRTVQQAWGQHPSASMVIPAHGQQAPQIQAGVMRHQADWASQPGDQRGSPSAAGSPSATGGPSSSGVVIPQSYGMPLQAGEMSDSRTSPPTNGSPTAQPDANYVNPAPYQPPSASVQQPAANGSWPTIIPGSR